MRRFVAAVVAAVAMGTALLVAQDADRQFKAAMNMELVDGNLTQAIEQYMRLASGGDRAIAAQALIRIAECYRKLGDSRERTVYERVVRDFADQTEPARLAQARLDATTPNVGETVALRRLWDARASASGAVVMASVSASGQRLPYVAPGGVLKLYDFADDTDRAIAPADQCGGPSTISRDGALVAYERYCGRYGSELRLVVPVDAGVSTSRLLYENPDVTQITPLDISPDKAVVAVTLVRQDRTRQIGLVTTTGGELRVLKSVDWRGPSRMFFAPDGRSVAYDLPATARGQQRDVFVLAVDASREVPVVAHPAHDIVLGWSPDGRHLLFASDRGGSSMGLWAQALVGGTPSGPPQLVTESLNSTFSLGVTGSGSLYLGKLTGDRDIAVLPIDLVTGRATGPPSRPIQSFVGTNLEPAFSPDGRFLAYISWRNNNPIFGEPRVLAVRALDTGETRELRPDLAYFDQVAWAPDGSAFVTGGTDLMGRAAVVRIDARSGAVTLIAPLPFGFETAYPQWSTDGLRVYYRVPLSGVARMGEVAVMEHVLATGAEREIARGRLGSLSVSPDGHWLAAVDDDPTTSSQSIALIPTEPGTSRALFKVLAPERIPPFSGMPWTADGQALVVRKRATTPELWLVPVDGREPRKLDIDVSQWALGNRGLISMSPDGRAIAYLTGETTSEVWALENFQGLLAK